MMWDQKYSVDAYLYGTEPNEFLLSMTTKLKKGRVLCLAEGEGRNAVYLAKEGFAVTAVYSSRVGLAKAEKLARKHQVNIETLPVDLAEFSIGENCWDSIVSIFCHLPPKLRKQVHNGVVTGLRKGGTFLLEAYTPEQLARGTGGPPSAEIMMELDTITEELSGLKILHGAEVLRNVLEGTKHTGVGSVVQVLAQKI